MALTRISIELCINSSTCWTCLVLGVSLGSLVCADQPYYYVGCGEITDTIQTTNKNNEARSVHNLSSIILAGCSRDFHFMDVNISKEFLRRNVDATRWPSGTYRLYIRGVVSEADINRSNYIPQIVWDVINCPCPLYLPQAQHSPDHKPHTRQVSGARCAEVVTR